VFIIIIIIIISGTKVHMRTKYHFLFVGNPNKPSRKNSVSLISKFLGRNKFSEI